MKIRYYLRGLGIGIVVAALLMGFTKGGQKETLTDAEIVERAKSLGMVESSVLSADLGNKQDLSVNDISELNQQEDAQQTESESEKDNPEQVESEIETNNPTQTDSEKEIAKDNPEEVESVTESEKTGETTKTDAENVKTDQADAADKTDNSKDTEPVTSDEIIDKQEPENTTEKRYVVTIYSGDGSRTVANRLEEMGVIDDAAAFDRYLCQNGYDKRLTTGNHEIDAGADKKEIAEALVKRVN